MLIGHHRPREIFLNALAGDRMHHAWLITGPRGIGKRCFADWAALKLLSGSSTLNDTPSDNPAAALVVAGSHPDHRVLSPPTEGKGSSTAAILVDQVRDLADFLHSYPAIAPWRTLIVDAIDDMNPNTANAFLKELEEPRQNTVYLLISHSPARLLPTIRSRCRPIRLLALLDEEARSVIDTSCPGLSDSELDQLLALAHGAPGSVMDLAGADFGGLEAAIDRVVNGGDAMVLVRSVQPQSAAARYQALLALAPRRIARIARTTPDPRILELYSQAEAIARSAVPLAYDRGQVAMALADIIARAGRFQGSQ